MRFLSLFAGIGGFDLGLERSGMRCVGQVEIESFPCKVLAKHWPDVWRFNDVRRLTGELIRQHCGRVDLICGGVPCQPASVAGKRKGAADDRWLWPDFLRVVSEVNPLWVLAENPRGVLSLEVEGMQFGEWLAREFAARGYELFPVELAAEDVGAPHRRERIFFIGRCMDDARRERLEAGRSRSEQAQTGKVFNHQPECSSEVAVADAESIGERESDHAQRSITRQRTWKDTGGRGNGASQGVGLADACEPRLAGRRECAISAGAEVALSSGFGGYQWPSRPGQPQHEWEEPRTSQSGVGSSTDELSVRLAGRHRVAALKALGNAIVPQVAEVIGRMIMEAA